MTINGQQPIGASARSLPLTIESKSSKGGDSKAGAAQSAGPESVDPVLIICTADGPRPGSAAAATGAAATAGWSDSPPRPMSSLVSTAAATAVPAGAVQCRSLQDLADYSNPLAAGTLTKCVLLAMGVVSLESKLTLQQQIQLVSRRSRSRM